MAELQEKRLFLLDMDGTIYLSDTLFDKVPEFLDYVKAIGGRYLFLTNNSSRGVEGYIDRMARLGIATTREDFQAAYGKGDSMEDAYIQGINDVCQKYNYSWGHATMAKTKTGWVLAELYFTTTQFVGPRSTGIGNTEEHVVGQFRDMGQVQSPSGNRGLYDNEYGTGKIYLNEDGTKLIRYVNYTADSHEWQLDYELNKSGYVEAIRMLYIP